MVGAAFTPVQANGAAPEEGGHGALPSLLPGLRALARRMLRDAEDAMDVAQDAALKALAARNVPTDARAYRAWLYQITRNAAVDLRRRKPPPLPAEAEAADPWLFDRALISALAVRQALRTLSADHRSVLLLVDVEGLSYAEAAQRLTVPVGTVMSRVARARAALLLALEKPGR